MRDEVNTVLFGKRYYNPSTGRWTTPDPRGFADGPNLYAYIHNNPLTLFDLYGEFSMGDAWRGSRDAVKGAYHATRDKMSSIGSSIKERMGSFSRSYSNTNFSDHDLSSMDSIDAGLIDPSAMYGVVAGSGAFAADVAIGTAHLGAACAEAMGAYETGYSSNAMTSGIDALRATVVNPDSWYVPSSMDRNVFSMSFQGGYYAAAGITAGIAAADLAVAGYRGVSGLTRNGRVLTKEIYTSASLGKNLHAISNSLENTCINNIEHRITRGGDKAIRIRYENGLIKDISLKRAKEYLPSNHPNAPPNTMMRVKFDNALSGTKGYKRLPTNDELRLLE